MLIINYDQLVRFEAEAWYYSLVAKKEATRISADLVREELQKEIQKRRSLLLSF